MEKKPSHGLLVQIDTDDNLKHFDNSEELYIYLEKKEQSRVPKIRTYTINYLEFLDIETYKYDHFFHNICCNLYAQTIKLPENLFHLERHKLHYSCIFDKPTLKKIIIPNSVTKIDEDAFRNCVELKEIKLPNNLMFLESGVFINCSSLEEIIIPEKVTTLKDSIFFDCKSLKYIKFGKKFRQFEGGSIFFGCKSLQLLEFDLENGIDFEKIILSVDYHIKQSKIQYPSSIIINYYSSSELVSSITKTTAPTILQNFKQITFKGPPISIFKKSNIFSKLSRDKCKFITQKSNINNINNNINDLELLELLKKIDELIIHLPPATKLNILNLKNNIIEKYKQEKEQEKPQLDINSTSNNTIILNNKNNLIGNAKLTAIIELNNLIYSLSKQNQLLALLEEFDKYREILQTKPNNLNNNINTSEQLLQNLAYIISKLNTSKKIEINTKIEELLNNIEQEFKNQLKSDINSNDSINLNLNSRLDPKQDLYLKLHQLYDNVISYYNTILPFLEVYEALNSKIEDINEYKEDNSIESLIKNIYFIIKKLEIEETKKELIHKFEIIKNNFSDNINHLIKNEDLSKEKYKTLILNLRTELQTLLEYLNKIVTKEKIYSKLLKQFEESLIFIENYNSISEYPKTNTTELFIIDIFTCLESSYFNEEEKQKIKQQTYNIINTSISMLKTSTTEEKTKEIEKLTYKKLTELLLVTSEYIKKVKSYNKTYFKSPYDKKSFFHLNRK